MDLRIDARSPVPIYAQIVDGIRTLVARRALRTGEQVPSVRELAARLRVNRNTAAKAYQMLEHEGYLETRVGQGTFVAKVTPLWSTDAVRERLVQRVDALLMEALHLGVSFDDLPELLAARARRFAPTASTRRC